MEGYSIISRDEQNLIEEIIIINGRKPDERFPKVSIFWLNYNSMAFKDLVLESLESVCKLEYPNFEIIIVDNGSSDGSYELIKNFLKNSIINAETVKIIKLKKNMGFTGGNNIAYRFMNPSAKYFILLNNDAIPYPDSVAKLVKAMEDDASLGAAQGIILNLHGKYVDTAGGFVDIMLRTYKAYTGLLPTQITSPLDISYADGAYSIYRVSAVRDALGRPDKIFDDIMFLYYDDTFLGLKLWNKGFKVKLFPIIVARHYRSRTSHELGALPTYYGIRNRIALILSSNTKFKLLALLLALRSIMSISIIMKSMIHRNRRDIIIAYLMALKHGIKISKLMKARKEGIDMNRAKILYISPLYLVLGLVSKRIFHKLMEKWFKKHAFNGIIIR